VNLVSTRHPAFAALRAEEKADRNTPLSDVACAASSTRVTAPRLRHRSCKPPTETSTGQQTPEGHSSTWTRLRKSGGGPCSIALNRSR
jgi:hypothetical protein